MWSCPFCGGRTRPASLSELRKLLNDEKLKEILEEFRSRENPIIVKCEKCGKVWVDEV